jgi:hypothetical protein
MIQNVRYHHTLQPIAIYVAQVLDMERWRFTVYDERLSTPDDDEEERPRSLIKGLVDGEEEMVDVEKEQGQEAAFNPETGEINWDCPCLGGMANGPW